MSDELANVINSMGSEDESFALLLEYTEKSIEDLGSGALKGVDSARFRILKEANSLVPVDKNLRFGSLTDNVTTSTRVTRDRSRAPNTRNSRLLRGLPSVIWKMWQNEYLRNSQLKKRLLVNL
ncbi:hypothetical protein GQ600_9579 [Phytophthora cactorum]|nr:hypothetical protein GQ600_9579 [Phytophthora cactorum]